MKRRKAVMRVESAYVGPHAASLKRIRDILNKLCKTKSIEIPDIWDELDFMEAEHQSTYDEMYECWSQEIDENRELRDRVQELEAVEVKLDIMIRCGAIKPETVQDEYVMRELNGVAAKLTPDQIDQMINWARQEFKIH